MIRHAITVAVVGLVYVGAAAPAHAAIPSDWNFAKQYGLNNTGQAIDGVTGTPDADIDAPEAWDVTTGSSSVVVADVDDGIDLGQRDFAGNTVAGYDFGNGDADPTESDSAHGSQTAALIG